MIRTAEFVSPKHPDKLCDRLADALVDHFLTTSRNARCAIEILAGHGAIHIVGEVSVPGLEQDYINADAKDFTIDWLARNLPEFNADPEQITVKIVAQSAEIARGLDVTRNNPDQGAGDQGIVVGMATKETASTGEFMPIEYALARDLCRFVYGIRPEDGKTQVTVDGSTQRIADIVVSWANTKTADLKRIVKDWLTEQTYMKKAQTPKLHINPAGDWSQSGWDADTGLTGRKLAVDTYGPACPNGGGALSGKDPSKTDRSGAYKARQLALRLLRHTPTSEEFGEVIIVTVRLAFAIGEPLPVEATAMIAYESGAVDLIDFNNPESIWHEEITPLSIASELELLEPQFENTAEWGHFGNPDFTWEMDRGA